MIPENDGSFCIKLPFFVFVFTRCFWTAMLMYITWHGYVSQCRSLTLVKDLIIQTFLARHSALTEKQKWPIFLYEFMTIGKISLTMVWNIDLYFISLVYYILHDKKQWNSASLATSARNESNIMYCFKTFCLYNDLLICCSTGFLLFCFFAFRNAFLAVCIR